MKKFIVFLILPSLIMVLPGCWSKYELTERGFVMGVGLDLGDKDNIEMTTQIYRPKATREGGMSRSSNLNIRTSNKSVMEAIRDIPIHLGRKAQWSHMRVIVIGEKLARSTDIGKLLDLFYRDHEPRSNVSIMISKGTARNLMEKQPLIEQTTGQQLLRSKEFSYRASSKTLDSNLLTLVLQFRSPHNDAIVSYVYEEENAKEMFSAAGIALIKKGKMTSVMSSTKMEGVLMLRNEYHTGVVEHPCENAKDGSETVELLKLNTKIKPILTGKQIKVHVSTKADGAIGELKCTSIKTLEDEAAFVHKMEEDMKHQMQTGIRFLQAEKVDGIGIGNLIYRFHPKQWKKLKNDWDDRFADITFEIDVQLRLITNGTSINKPALSESK